MDNPFSAPASKAPSPSPEFSNQPPPLEGDSDLPPVRPELDILPVPGTPAQNLPPIQDTPNANDESEMEAIATPTVAPEFAESKIDLETENTLPSATADSKSEAPAEVESERGVEDEEEEHVFPQSSPPSPSHLENVASKSHHQPTSHAPNVGWSNADFPDHKTSELPKLSMDEKSCRMCKYFHFEEGTRSSVRFGECRRTAPVGIGKALWPSVLWESWCGEWAIGVGQEEMMQMARSVADSVAER